MSTPTPEDRRDAAILAIRNAGGSVGTPEPLVHPDNPQVVVSYGLPWTVWNPALRAGVVAALEPHLVDAAGLVPWKPEEVPLVEE